MATKTLKYTTPAAITTGIDGSAATTSGSNVVGSAIDNTTNLDMYADFELEWVCTTAPTADDVIALYLLESLDGTNYEDGSTSVDPKGVPILTAPAYADTDTHRITARGVRIPPTKYKLLAVNNLDQSATITVTGKSYNMSAA